MCVHVFACNKMCKLCVKDSCAVLTYLVQSCILCKGDTMKS